MKVRLIKKQTIEDFILKNARSKTSFEIGLSVIKRADWNEPNEIIRTFNSADVLGKSSDSVVFNIEKLKRDFQRNIHRLNKQSPPSF